MRFTRNPWHACTLAIIECAPQNTCHSSLESLIVRWTFIFSSQFSSWMVNPAHLQVPTSFAQQQRRRNRSLITIDIDSIWPSAWLYASIYYVHHFLIHKVHCRCSKEQHTTIFSVWMNETGKKNKHGKITCNSSVRPWAKLMDKDLFVEKTNILYDLSGFHFAEIAICSKWCTFSWHKWMIG